MKHLEAETFLLNVTFDGAPAVLYARVFIDNGRVVGVRRCRLKMHIDPEHLDCVGSEIPVYDDGKREFTDEELSMVSAGGTAPGSACAPSPESPQATADEPETVAASSNHAEPPRG